jgi:hypothetical protein
MPIGLTAKGDMVFPLQCRESIEHQGAPATPAPTARQAPAPPLLPDSGRHKGSTERTDVVLNAATKPEPSTRPSAARTDPVEEQDEVKTANVDDRKGSEHQAAAAALDEGAPDDVSAPSAKHLGQRSALEQNQTD